MLLAIDIGSKHIHIVEGEYRNKRFKIARSISEQTPEVCVMDGEIVNEDEIITKLRNILQRNKIRTKQVVFTINPGSMISRRLIIPNVKKKETLPILQNEMDGQMGFAEPHLVDFTDIEQTEEGAFSIDAVALSKDTIRQYRDIAKKLKLQPIALDIHQNVLYKFVMATSDIEYKNIILADIGNNYMNTYLLRDGSRVFARRMMINTEQYERTLVSLGKLKAMDSDFHRLDLSPYSLGRDPILENTITQYLTNIVDQLQRVMQFHMSMGTKGQMSQVSHIYLCGGMANMKGLTEYIASYMDVRVESINQIVSPRVCKVERLPQYANAIGALVRLD